MGKKAKLKQIRKTQPSEPIQESSDPQQFVKNLAEQGYSLRKMEQAPEVPEKRIPNRL